MKKINKVLALALALTLVLGMSALADTAMTQPTEIIYTDDFSDASDLSWDTFKLTRTPHADFKALGTFAPVEGAVKYYNTNIAANATIVNVNGTLRLMQNSTTTAQDKMGIAFAIPGGWSYEDHDEGLDALVAEIEWTPVELTYTPPAGYNYDPIWPHGGWMGVVEDDVMRDGTDAVSNRIYSLIGAGRYKDANDVITISLGGGNFPKNQTGSGNGESNVTGIGGSKSYVEGETANITMVVRQHAITGGDPAYGYTLYEDNTVRSDQHLNVVKYTDYNVTMNQAKYTSVTSNDTQTRYVENIKAFFFTASSEVRGAYSNFRMYKVSLDRNDFTYEQDAMKTAGIANSEPFVIQLSQPVTRTGVVYSPMGMAENDTLYKTMKILPEGSEEYLVYGEDFTVDTYSKIIGTEMKGFIEITPVGHWDYSKTYTVTIPGGLSSVARISMLGENNVPLTFTTEAGPTIVTNLYKGLAEGQSIAIENAAGKTVYVKADITNSTSTAINGNIIIGIYDADNNLVKFASSTKTIGKAGTGTFAAAFKLAAGQTVRASFAQ